MLWRSLCKMPDLLCISTLTRALASMTWTHLRQRDFKTIKEELWLWPPKTWDPEVSEHYLRLQKVQNVTGRLADIGHCYLGSPVIAQHFLRPQDASLLFEASSPVAQALEENLRPLGPLGPLHATRVCCGSCYRWFSEDLEIPRGSRVLALIDPPYDSASSSDRWNLYLVKQIRERWTDSCLDCQHFSPKDEVINHQPPWLLGKIWLVHVVGTLEIFRVCLKLHPKKWIEMGGCKTSFALVLLKCPQETGGWSSMIRNDI